MLPVSWSILSTADSLFIVKLALVYLSFSSNILCILTLRVLFSPKLESVSDMLRPIFFTFLPKSELSFISTRPTRRFSTLFEKLATNSVLLEFPTCEPNFFTSLSVSIFISFTSVFKSFISTILISGSDMK